MRQREGSCVQMRLHDLTLTCVRMSIRMLDCTFHAIRLLTYQIPKLCVSHLATRIAKDLEVLQCK